MSRHEKRALHDSLRPETVWKSVPCARSRTPPHGWCSCDWCRFWDSLGHNFPPPLARCDKGTGTSCGETWRDDTLWQHHIAIGTCSFVASDRIVIYAEVTHAEDGERQELQTEPGSGSGLSTTADSSNQDLERETQTCPIDNSMLKPPAGAWPPLFLLSVVSPLPQLRNHLPQQ
jgi:hypothetical protein